METFYTINLIMKVYIVNWEVFNIMLPWLLKGTSRSKLYKELGLESLKSRTTLRRLFVFHKIVSTRPPAYLFNLIPQSTHAYQTRTLSNIPT